MRRKNAPPVDHYESMLGDMREIMSNRQSIDPSRYGVLSPEDVATEKAKRAQLAQALADQQTDIAQTNMASSLADKIATTSGGVMSRSLPDNSQFREATSQQADPYKTKLKAFDDESVIGDKNYDRLVKADDLEQRRIDRLLALKLQMEQLKGNREDRALTRDIALNDKLDTQTQKLGEAVKGPQDVMGSLKQMDSVLGFNLDEADVKDGNVRVGGKKKDLPGVSIPGIGRTSFYNKDARVLETSIAKVFNTELKDRSGAAVTNPEMERMKIEFASGKYNSEAEMVGALQQYKTLAAQEMRNREAGFSTRTKEAYKSRGGQTSDSFSSKPSGKVRVSNGSEVLEIDSSDLADAEKDGYKRVR